MMGAIQTTVAVVLLLLASAASAEEGDHATSAGDLRIIHAWTRTSHAGDDTLVFMEIENAGAADRLTGGRSAVAGEVRIVGLTMVSDEVSAAPLGPVEVPRGQLELDPGGLAVELRGLTQSLAEGDELELTLTFERTGDVPIDVAVEAADARQHSHAGHRH